MTFAGAFRGINQAMNRPQKTEEFTPSRFVYHTEDDDPGEGGVVSTRFMPSGRAGEPSPEDLLLDISELARTTGMRYTHNFALAPRSADFAEMVSPQTGVITLTNSGAALLIQGNVQADMEMDCGRCLTTTVQHVETDIEEDFELLAKRNAFNQEEVEAIDEDTPAAVIASNILNLGELVRQSLLLAAPPQPLCREDCPGVLVNGLPVIKKADEPDAPKELQTANPLRSLGALLEKYGESTEEPAAVEQKDRK